MQLSGRMLAWPVDVLVSIPAKEMDINRASWKQGLLSLSEGIACE